MCQGRHRSRAEEGVPFSVSFKLYVAVYVLKRSPPPCPASVSALTHMSAREWGDLFPSSPCKWTTRRVMGKGVIIKPEGLLEKTMGRRVYSCSVRYYFPLFVTVNGYLDKFT